MKKGYSVNALPVLAIIFVVGAVTVSMGAQILAGVQGQQTAGTYAYNITGQGLSGLNTFGTWLPTIAIVLMAAIVIGILLYSFKFKGGA